MKRRILINPAADKVIDGLGAGTLSTDDIVALDDRSDANRFVIIVRSLVHANHASVGPDEYLGAASDFRW